MLLFVGVLYMLYLDISSGNVGLGTLKMPFIFVVLVCQLVRQSEIGKREHHVPAEIKEHEDYVLAKNRVDIGSKIGIAGLFMISVPIIALIALKDLHGFWARVAVYSALGGIPAAAAGLIFYLMGSHYITKTEAAYLKENASERETESKLSKICSIISAVVSVALLAVILMD